MVCENVIVQCKLGLHARPASLFSKSAFQFKSKIQVIKNGKSCDAKSILGILSLCVKCGDEITIRCEGEDEQSALNKLVEIAKGMQDNL